MKVLEGTLEPEARVCLKVTMNLFTSPVTGGEAKVAVPFL